MKAVQKIKKKKDKSKDALIPLTNDGDINTWKHEKSSDILNLFENYQSKTGRNENIYIYIYS